MLNTGVNFGIKVKAVCLLSASNKASNLKLNFMVRSEIKTFANANEFREIIFTITENDYFVIGAENTTICICNNSFMNVDNYKTYSLSELCELAKGTNDICIERNYFNN